MTDAEQAKIEITMIKEVAGIVLGKMECLRKKNKFDDARDPIALALTILIKSYCSVLVYFLSEGTYADEEMLIAASIKEIRTAYSFSREKSTH